MKKKYRIKKSAKNEFSALTGLPATQLSGSCDCLVAHQLTCSPSATTAHIPSNSPVAIHRFAYSVYHQIPLHKIERVVQSCGVDQCVKREHLIGTLKTEGTWGS